MADEATTAQETTDNAATGDDQAAGNAQPTDDKAATPDEGGEGEQQADEAGDAPQGAPEKYEFKAPEGVELDAEAVAVFEPIAKELNLTNEQAQKLVDLYAGRMGVVAQAQQEAWQKQLDTWVGEVKADKEIGGKGFADNVKSAQDAIKKFGTPELKAALESTGFGNHPELVRVFARIGKAMAEDTFVGSSNSGGKRSVEELFYGST